MRSRRDSLQVCRVRGTFDQFTDESRTNGILADPSICDSSSLQPADEGLLSARNREIAQLDSFRLTCLPSAHGPLRACPADREIPHTLARSARKIGGQFFVKMKAKLTRRLQEHFLVRFTFWAQPTLTGFLLLQVALNERTRAPLNTVEGLCSALWLGEKSDVRCYLSWRATEKIHIDCFFFFASPCSLVCSVHKEDGAGNRLGRLRGCSGFTTAKKYGVVSRAIKRFLL